MENTNKFSDHIVDDDADMRSLVCDALQGMGFQPVEAVDGNDALEKSKAVPSDSECPKL